MISWKITKTESNLLVAIAHRAVLLFPAFSQQETCMDLTAAHANGCRLKLKELLHADEFNFGHDVLGIRQHTDRDTGKLLDCFVPRFAERVD